MESQGFLEHLAPDQLHVRLVRQPPLADQRQFADDVAGLREVLLGPSSLLLLLLSGQHGLLFILLSPSSLPLLLPSGHLGPFLLNFRGSAQDALLLRPA